MLQWRLIEVERGGNRREGGKVRRWVSVLKVVLSGQALKQGLFLCLVASLLQLAGCAGSLKRPEIALVSIELVGLGRVEQRFMFTLNIRNPNDVDFSLTALNFDLEFNGAQFAKGASEKAVLIPRQGEALVEVMTVSRLAQVVAVWRDVQKQGHDRVAYRIVGSAEVEGYGRIPFDRNGEISMPTFGKIAPK